MRIVTYDTIDGEDRVVDGRRCKYYIITDRGQVALAEARLKIAELAGEVLEA